MAYVKSYRSTEGLTAYVDRAVKGLVLGKEHSSVRENFFAIYKAWASIHSRGEQEEKPWTGQTVTEKGKGNQMQNVKTMKQLYT